MSPTCAPLLVCLLLGTAAFCQCARLLKENDPATYTSVSGQTPGGFYAIGEGAEAGAGSQVKGIRYNGGRAITTGDAIPGQRAAAVTNLPRENSAAVTGMAGEADVNLGLKATSLTYEGARAVAGTGVMHSADFGAAVSSNTNAFRPGTVVNKGSVAFTDTAPSSAAVSGMGNGPTAIAWGNEVSSMARSWREKPTPASKRFDP